ncbi:MAG: NAD(P)-binding oxidoreductase [Pseudomonadota bacterium]
MSGALVVGASGATGSLLVAELLDRGINVYAIVRPSSSHMDKSSRFPNYHEISASLGEMSESDLIPLLNESNFVFSCLGHNLTLKGVYGKPRRLVTDAIQKISGAIQTLKPDRKIKIVLMNTTGNSNRDIPEVPPLSQRIVVSIVRVLVPPHADNEQVADFLRCNIGQDDQFIKWVVVRPDGLTNEDSVTQYSVHPSPTRNVIFDAGSTSRINVANFMVDLASDPDLWGQWKGKMPVIYNEA